MSEGNGKVKTSPLFELAQAMMAAAEKCRAEKDPTPCAVVIRLDEYGYAKGVWDAMACDPKSPHHGVQMDLTPDHREKDLAVLLFRKKKA